MVKMQKKREREKNVPECLCIHKMGVVMNGVRGVVEVGVPNDTAGE